MELVIDFDKIEDPIKRKSLIDSLKLLEIDFHMAVRRQTIEEYNQDLADAEAQIERGEYITVEELKILSEKW